MFNNITRAVISGCSSFKFRWDEMRSAIRRSSSHLYEHMIAQIRLTVYEHLERNRVWSKRSHMLCSMHLHIVKQVLLLLSRLCVTMLRVQSRHDIMRIYKGVHTRPWFAVICCVSKAALSLYPAVTFSCQWHVLLQIDSLLPSNTCAFMLADKAVKVLLLVFYSHTKRSLLTTFTLHSLGLVSTKKKNFVNQCTFAIVSRSNVSPWSLWLGKNFQLIAYVLWQSVYTYETFDAS